jgi:hypothetical protein
LISVEIERNNLVPALQANTLKNLHFLVVIASLPAKGSEDRVRNALSRSVDAIKEVEVVCLHFRIIVNSNNLGSVSFNKVALYRTTLSPNSATIILIRTDHFIKENT